MNIGDRIKQRRIELGLDADDLAKKIGKSRATVYRYENGDIENMPTTVLEPIAKALNVTPAYLMGWTEEEESAISNLADELNKIKNRTQLYIQLLETYGNKITINSDTVDVRTNNGASLTLGRKDFMSMIQRCHKDILYNFDRLIDNYSKKNKAPLLNAAHDNGATEEQKTAADDIMMDDKEWE